MTVAGVQRWEYRALPAPRRGNRVRGVKAPEERFAATIAEVMNEAGREGWEYLRSDTLPFEERQGLTGHATSWQVLLIFRRPLGEGRVAAPAPAVTVPVAVPAAVPVAVPAVPPLRAPVEPPAPAAVPPAPPPAARPAGD